MSSPVEITDLPEASIVNDGDLMLVRQPGNTLGTDKKVTADKVRNINVANLLALGNPAGSDLFLISRTVSGVPTNYQIAFSGVSFLRNTQMWFYQNSAPLGWTLQTSIADCLLGVVGANPGDTYNAAGSVQGNWQQEGVNGGNPGGGLSIQQIPNHTHDIVCGRTTSNSSLIHTKGTEDDNPGNPTVPSNGVKGSTQAMNTSAPHNHGLSWRPLAAVGIIARKD